MNATERKIRALAAMTVARGCTPQEAATAARKAQELSLKLLRARSGWTIKEAQARKRQAAAAFWHEWRAT